MTKKLFLKLSMLLFVLGMSTNAAWADMTNVPHYVAELTAKVSSTGGGKVYVATGQDQPAVEDYAATSTQYGGRPMSMPGVAMSQVPFFAWQKTDDGYYFVGWSYSDGGFDLGKTNPEFPGTEAYADLYDVSTQKSTFKVDDKGTEDESDDVPELDENGEVQFIEYNPARYTLYATFEPVRVASYSLSGSNTNTKNEGKWESTQTVTYTFSGENIDGDDFESIAIVPVDAAWTVNDDFTVNGEAKTGTVSVKFSTTSDEKQEYSANLRLTTKAGITMNITLNARTSSSDEEKELALYDGKSYKEDIDWSELDAKISEYSCTKPLIKLNEDREGALELSGNLSIDLAGHSIPSMTVNEGANVTLVSSPYGGTISGAVTNKGTLTLMGNTIEGTITNKGTLNQNGATIEGAVTNSGTMTTTDGIHHSTLTSTGTLVVNGGVFEPASDVAINVTDGTADVKKGTITGTTYGVQSADAETTIEKLAVIRGGTKALNGVNGTLKVNCGKFQNPENLANGTIVFKSAYFQNETGAIDDEVRGKHLWRNTSGAEFRNGYEYFAGDYSEAKKAGVSICHIGGTSYSSLEDALDYANNTNDKAIIIMDNDYSLPSGYYTLPENAVLIVPKSNDQGNETKTVERVTMADDENSNWQAPTRFRTLTLLAGVTMDVYGTIEVSGSQFSTNAAYASAVYGPYGCIQMNEGSKINLQSGSELRAWGYVTGDIEHKAADGNVPTGEIDARRGAMVREQFQMGDWKGAVFSGFGVLGMGSAPEVFPLTTYFIQNIEAPVKYHPGARLNTTASVAASQSEHPTLGAIMKNILHVNCLTMSANDIQIIGVTGDVAMFLMEAAADADNTWVRKWYDASKDQQVYEINSGAHIGNLVIPLVSSPLFKQADPRFPDQLNMNSGQYDLPLTNNFKLHVLSGLMDFTQSTELLPGAELEIDKEARVWVSPTEDVNSGALYVYDADDWGTYAGGEKARRVKYSPSFDGEPDVRDIEKLEDATILVHGTFDIAEDGYVYTSESGANIISTNEDAGSFTFSATNTTDTKEVKQVAGARGENPESKTFHPAVLRNKDGSAKETSGMKANHTCIYINDAWSSEEIFYFNCYTAEVDMAAYAADVQGKFNNIAIYHAPDNIAECLVGMALAKQAWSMDLTPAQYETMKSMISAENMAMIQGQVASMKADGYDLGGAVQHIYIKPQEWLEIAAQAHIKLNFDQDYLDGLKTNYEEGNYEDAVNAYMEYVQAQAYNPYLAGVDGNADHTYSDADGAGRLFILLTDEDNLDCQWWEVEQKDNLYHCIHPDNDTYYYWDDTNADASKHHWAEKMFTITWKDKKWGSEDETEDRVLQTYTVPYGTQAEWLSSSPTRPANADYTYNFIGWTPALDKVTSDVTYTATYEAKQIKYTIVFVEDGGVEIERHLLARNEWPVCENLPTRTGYTLEWTPAIAAVTDDATYTATWTQVAPDEYAIQFYDYDGTTLLKPIGAEPYMVKVDNMPEAPDITDGIPEGSIGKPATTEFTYVFDHWSPAIEAVSATSAKVYTAVYREVPRTYTISYYNEAGTATIGEQILSYGETPTPPAVAKENPAEGTRYTYVWRNKADIDASVAKPRAVETVTGNAAYIPVFSGEPINYSVSVKSNPSGACAIAGVGTYHYNDVATITLTKNEGYTFNGWSDLDNEDPDKQALSRTLTITQDTSLVANFTYEGVGVTINWMNEAGTENLVAPVNQKEGTATTYLGEIPTKPATAQYTYTFYGWTTRDNDGNILNTYKNGMTPKAAEGGAIYYAYFTETKNQYTVTLRNAIAGACEFRGAGVREYGTIVNIVATPNGDYEFVKWQETGSTKADFDLEVTGDVTLTAVVKEKEKPAPGDLALGLDEAETVASATNYTDVIITSDGISASSQIINANNITLYGNADFVLQKTFAGSTWYCVAVPWRVDVNGGILLNGTTPAVLGKNLDICYYDGSVRAAQGKVDACWVYMKNLSSAQQVLQPGRAYMIALRNGASSITFRKKAQEPLLTTGTSVNQYNSTTGDDADAGWNAVANPALFHAYVNAGTTDNRGQRYFSESDTYDWFYLNTHKLVVGEPVYVQAPAAKSIVVANGANYAPARRANVKAQPTSFDVNITAAGAAKYADHISISLNEDKEENRYVIGQDLVKFGVSSKVAQMWIDRYDSKLCVNTIAPESDASNFPLSIFAPKAGTYTIAIEREVAAEDYVLYLTYNGEAIWNLSEGAYLAHLNKGTDNKYGLRVSARVPQVTTGVDEAVVDAKGETRKVLINNHVFIIRGDKVYSVDGQLVK